MCDRDSSFNHGKNVRLSLSVHGSLSYFGESSELHVHLLNVDLFPWSLGPILYTGLAWREEWKHLICDSVMTFTEEKLFSPTVQKEIRAQRQLRIKQKPPIGMVWCGCAVWKLRNQNKNLFLLW